MKNDNDHYDSTEQTSKSAAMNRRDLLLGTGTAAVGLTAAAMAATAGAEPLEDASVFPVYFPRLTFTPEIDLAGKFAVITGASRGIGRATAEALVAQGVTVVGTSRDAANAPNPPHQFHSPGSGCHFRCIG